MGFSFYISDKDSQVIEWATYALVQIARRSDSVQAIVEAKALDRVLVLLESQSPKIREWTCELVGRLAYGESTVPTVLELKACVRLVCLLK
jgi:hypothetical protein